MNDDTEQKPLTIHYFEKFSFARKLEYLSLLNEPRNVNTYLCFERALCIHDMHILQNVKTLSNFTFV